MWKTAIWEGLDLQFAPDCEQNTAGFEAWTCRVAQEPWIVRLQELTEQKSWWVGNEA